MPLASTNSDQPADIRQEIDIKSAVMVLGLALLACTAGFSWSVVAQTSFRTQCLAFEPETFVYNSTREVLEYVPAGTNLTFPYNDASCDRPSQVVSTNLCRVALSVPTSNRSSFIYEHWLPESWSGRFLATGNGGIDGCVKYEDIAYATRNGFSATGTNNGHNGTGGLAFYQNPDVVTDYSWRALHQSVISGKALTHAFYNKTYTKSYYMGCSGGGRQGIKSAEMFPSDFDGILAGCPAVDFNNLYSWRARFYPITGSASSPDFIAASTWTDVVHPEVLKQCDGLDGVVDGIITDPNLCHFRPEALLCPTGTTNATVAQCLTPTQASQVRQIFDPYYGVNGTFIYPAMQPGSEDMAVTKLYAGAPFSYSEDWFRYVVLNHPSWDPATFNVQDAALAEALNPANVRTWPSDFSAFRNTSGKIITYHGTQDNQITSFNSERFYNHISRGMQASSTELDTFYRYFQVPGMFHCDDGPGPWVFGQLGSDASEGIPYTASSNILAALVDWVENGTAPDTILGTKFANDEVSDGIEFQRELCRYPSRSTYVGGNPNATSSWACKQVN